VLDNAGQHTRGALFTTDAQLDGVLCAALDELAHDPHQVKSLTNQRLDCTPVTRPPGKSRSPESR
jgi:hypothetical protein